MCTLVTWRMVSACPKIQKCLQLQLLHTDNDYFNMTFLPGFPNSLHTIQKVASKIGKSVFQCQGHNQGGNEMLASPVVNICAMTRCFTWYFDPRLLGPVTHQPRVTHWINSAHSPHSSHWIYIFLMTNHLFWPFNRIVNTLEVRKCEHLVKTKSLPVLNETVFVYNL